jgi:hypothetical protein
VQKSKIVSKYPTVHVCSSFTEAIELVMGPLSGEQVLFTMIVIIGTFTWRKHTVYEPLKLLSFPFLEIIYLKLSYVTYKKYPSRIRARCPREKEEDKLEINKVIYLFSKEKKDKTF